MTKKKRFYCDVPLSTFEGNTIKINLFTTSLNKRPHMMDNNT